MQSTTTCSRHLPTCESPSVTTPAFPLSDSLHQPACVWPSNLSNARSCTAWPRCTADFVMRSRPCHRRHLCVQIKNVRYSIVVSYSIVDNWPDPSTLARKGGASVFVAAFSVLIPNTAYPHIQELTEGILAGLTCDQE